MALVAHHGHACAVVDDGKEPRAVICWGSNYHAQIASPDSGWVGPTRVQGLRGATTVSVGREFTCGLVGQTVRCRGDLAMRGQPVGDQFETIQGVGAVTGLASGGFTGCAIEGGGVSCWGKQPSHFTQGLAPGTIVAEPVAGLAVPLGLTVSAGSACAWSAEGDLRCWGKVFRAKLEHEADPIPIGLAEVVDAGLGDEFGCAVLRHGDVWCWGSNHVRQLAQPSTVHRSDPVRIPGLPPAARIGVGTHHACALTRGGDVWCWGSLPHPSENRRTEWPVTKVRGVENARRIASGSGFACAGHDDHVTCWGDNDVGQLGVPPGRVSGPVVVRW